MTIKIVEHHLSRNVPVFVRARKIIDKQKICSVEDILSVIEELTMYEQEIRNLRKSVFEVTYSDILFGLIEPLAELYEEEYKSI
jgi:hypothetical protein